MISPIASELAEAVALLDPPSMRAMVEYAWELAREDHARRTLTTLRATPGAHGLDKRSYPCR